MLAGEALKVGAVIPDDVRPALRLPFERAQHQQPRRRIGRLIDSELQQVVQDRALLIEKRRWVGGFRRAYDGQGLLEADHIGDEARPWWRPQIAGERSRRELELLRYAIDRSLENLRDPRRCVERVDRVLPF